MGEGEEVKTRDEPSIDIEERGEIYFFYRPKVNREEVASEDDVQRLYIVLRPESGATAVEQKQAPDSGKEGKKKASADQKDEKGDSNKDSSTSSDGGHGVQEVNIEKDDLMRLLIMGKKSLPDPSKNQKGRPYWGFVELVTTNIEDIKNALKGEDYETKTRGHRHKPPARALGEGVYRILKHGSNKSKTTTTHTHLIYKLEFPSPEKFNEEEEQQSPQKSLNIDPEASFIIQIKNPNQKQRSHQQSSSSSFGGLQSKRKAAFPAHLQGKLGGSKRFCPADPPDLLNYEGCEFLLISASDDLEDELGLQLKGEEEQSAGDKEEDAYHCSDLVHTFGDTAPTTPLFQGSWA